MRFALFELVELPDKLAGGATRRTARLRTGAPVERPDDGPLGALRSVGSVVRDYSDVVGGWGAVAKRVIPGFWLLTAAALPPSPSSRCWRP